MDQFSVDSLDVIDKNIKKHVPDNTVKSKISVICNSKNVKEKVF